MLPTRGGAYLAGASQPAMSSDIRSASQPAADMQLPYCDLKLVSFNFGTQAAAMTSAEQEEEHAVQTAKFVDTMGASVRPDFIFGCEMASQQHG